MNSWMYQESGFMMPRMTRAVRMLLLGTLAVFVAQVLTQAGNVRHFDRVFGLTVAFLHGAVWQIATYMFLHGGVGHIFMNMLLLYFLGPDVERAIGTRRFTILYLGCGMLGGLGWLLISGRNAAVCVGASGAVFGVLGAFAALFPDRRVALLFPPVTLTARALAVGMGILVLLSLVGSAGGGIAHAAHLVGGIAGYAYGLRAARLSFYGYYPEYSSIRVPEWIERLAARWHRLKSRISSRFRAARLGARGAVRPPSQKEVDAVLDKLAQGGWGALTKKDRDILDRASRAGRARQ